MLNYICSLNSFLYTYFITKSYIQTHVKKDVVGDDDCFLRLEENIVALGGRYCELIVRIPATTTQQDSKLLYLHQ